MPKGFCPIASLFGPDQAEHDIRLFLRQPDRTHRRAQLDPDRRMRFEQFRERGQQQILAQKFGRLDTDRPDRFAFPFLRVSLEGPHLRCGALGRGDQVAAGLGQVVAVPVRPEEPDLQIALQRVDAPGHGRRADPQSAGRARERFRMGDGEKVFQVIPVHGNGFRIWKAELRKE
jgi:hypothetical protein